MEIGIIGANGMIGQNINEQYSNISNVSKITRENFTESANKKYNILFVTAADARKYWVNQNPHYDLKHLCNLAEGIKNYTFEKLVLISSIDVYNQVENKGDEKTLLKFENPSYGDNRLFLELLLKSEFQNKLHIIRLQGIIANNLKKNPLYDLKFKNELYKINKNNILQFYPISKLKQDIDLCIMNEINLANISCEPIKLSEIFIKYYPHLLSQADDNKPQANYDVKSIYSETLLNKKDYWIPKDDIFKAIEDYFSI